MSTYIKSVHTIYTSRAVEQHSLWLAAFVLGTGVNIWKQSQIFPQSGGSTPSDKDKAKGLFVHNRLHSIQHDAFCT